MYACPYDESKCNNDQYPPYYRFIGCKHDVGFHPNYRSTRL